MSEFEIKDSGKRIDFSSGMRRDTQDNKPRYDLIWEEGLYREAMHMAKGAKKYGERNWELANSKEELDRFKASLLRHAHQLVNGETDEDHMSAVCFNARAIERLHQLLRTSTKKIVANDPRIEIMRKDLS